MRTNTPIQLDTAKLWSALNTERMVASLSWRDVAKETGVSASTFSRLHKGKRPDTDSFLSILQWMDVDASEFAVRRGKAPSPRTCGKCGQRLSKGGA